jgi:hypothetical protein
MTELSMRVVCGATGGALCNIQDLTPLSWLTQLAQLGFGRSPEGLHDQGHDAGNQSPEESKDTADRRLGKLVKWIAIRSAHSQMPPLTTGQQDGSDARGARAATATGGSRVDVPHSGQSALFSSLLWPSWICPARKTSL